MPDSVLISTHDLPRAGKLRDAFRGVDLKVELVTPNEAIGETEAQLLILTGPIEESGGGTLLGEARQIGLPVIAHVAGAVRSVDRPPEGVSEIFSTRADPDEVALVGRRLIQRHHLQEVTGITGETDAIREALERVIQIAPSNSTVLVTGESGTGKELVARGIHALSARRHKSFIAVNVAALSDTLLESELFGHEKGAFTGAVDSRRGLFELANGGTIFLDEIGEMPLVTQTKLLRVLEQREFLRVGGEDPIRVDVRIITATNQDLRQLVALREFRKDLYYRLNVLRIELPPLRERRDDIPLLVERFVREASERNDRVFPGISPEAMEILRDHYWPGNIRELRNLVESMVVLSPGRVIGPEDIPDEVRRAESGKELLPAAIPRARSGDEGGEGYRPELEFIFRTLVDLRVDIDDLRKDFETYRETRTLPANSRLGSLLGEAEERRRPTRDFSGVEILDVDDEGGITLMDPSSEPVGESREQEADEDAVVWREGMTMEDLEREAIRVALRRVGGNRRIAAEELGIGERTLYRKIKRYGLEE